jgi:hypothetical protein
MEKSYNFKMQTSGVQFLAKATISSFKAPEKIDDWMVIHAIVFTIIHFKMSMLISEYKDKSKN